MPADVVSVARAIDVALRAEANPQRAVQEKRYLKSEREHYGASVPAIRRVTLEAVRAAALDAPAAVAVAEQLWASPVHECRMAAVEMLAAKARDLDESVLAVVEPMLREAATWALVDGLAASVVGVVVLAHPAGAATTDRWAHDDNFWLRRSALLSLLAGVRAGSPERVRIERYCDGMLDEREFFIRKAVGWLLRELGRRDPEWVVSFLADRPGRASGVTMREAVKPLDPAARQRLGRP